MKNHNIRIERVVDESRLEEYAIAFDKYWWEDEAEVGDIKETARVNYRNFLNHPDQTRGYLAIDVTTNKIIGFIIIQLHFFTGAVEKICYLSELYVSSEYRQQGIARYLLDFLQALAKEEKWFRIYWMTRPENYRAQGLYNQIADRSPFFFYQIPFKIAGPAGYV